MSKTKPTLLITGSNGFLGQKLTDLFAAAHTYKVYASSKSPNRNPNTDGFSFEQLDISDSDALDAFLLRIKPTIIINCAAISSVEGCEADKPACQALNVDAVRGLAAFAKAHDAYLVQLSTDFVFDGTQGPYSETDSTAPLSEYGRSKVASEQLLAAADIRYSVLRTILVYGVHADKGRSNLLLWAKSSLAEGKSIKTVADQCRTPTFVDDLARACQLAVEQQAQGIFHISGEELMSISEVVRTVADYWGLDKSLISEVTAADIGQGDNRPRKTGFNIAKAKTVLGFSPTPFRDSLKIIDQQIDYYTK